MTDPAALGLAIVERLRAYDRARPTTISSARGTRTVYPLINPDGPEAAQCTEMLVEALKNLLECAGRRRPDGHYKFMLVPNRDVEAARAALAKVRGADDPPNGGNRD